VVIVVNYMFIEVVDSVKGSTLKQLISIRLINATIPIEA
jgi:hypothetical protein